MRPNLAPYAEDDLNTAAVQGRIARSKGDTYFVDAAKTADNQDGKSWDTAFGTLTQALNNAGNNDTIIVAAGTYDEAAILDITQNNLTILGASFTGLGKNRVVLRSNTSGDHILKVNGNNVELAGLTFRCETDTKDGIRLAVGGAIAGGYIHDCFFYADTAGEYGIYTGDSNDAADIVIENCRFKDMVTAGIRVNGTRNIIRNCVFNVPGSGIGIEYIPDSAATPNSMIYRNVVLGSNSSDTGIKITNTPNAGALAIADNMILGAATTITQTANNAQNTAENYTSDASGGVLIDTVA